MPSAEVPLITPATSILRGVMMSPPVMPLEDRLHLLSYARLSDRRSAGGDSSTRAAASQSLAWPIPLRKAELVCSPHHELGVAAKSERLLTSQLPVEEFRRHVKSALRCDRSASGRFLLAPQPPPLHRQRGTSGSRPSPNHRKLRGRDIRYFCAARS